MKLNHTELEKRLDEIPGWEIDGETIKKEFKFDDFAGAFGFMAAAAVIAEKLDHHPDWSNVYNKVTVKLTTHDEGGVTGKDFVLAEAMNRLASN